MNFNVSDMLYYNEHMEMYEAQTLVDKMVIPVAYTEPMEEDDES